MLRTFAAVLVLCSAVGVAQTPKGKQRAVKSPTVVREAKPEVTEPAPQRLHVPARIEMEGAWVKGQTNSAGGV